VKKLGLSLELSYTSIRKYALSYLNRAIQCLQFHLGEVLGMARWYNRFGVLGLSEAAVQGTGYDCLDNKRDLFKNSVFIPLQTASTTWGHLRLSLRNSS